MRRTLALLALLAAVAACHDAPTAASDFEPASPADARGGVPTVIVTTLDDDPALGDTPCGPAGCSLRQALMNAPNGANISFRDDLCARGGSCSIIVEDILAVMSVGSSGDEIPVSVTVNGPKAWHLTLDKAGRAFEVLSIAAMTTATIRNLTVTGSALGTGNAGPAEPCTNNIDFYANGGIGNAGTLELVNVVVRDNASCYHGGGISNSGTLVLTNSAVYGNTSYLSGGGIHNVAFEGDGISLAGRVTISGSTITGNTVLTPPGDGIGVGGGLSNLDGTVQLLKGVCIEDNTPAASQVYSSGTVTGAWSSCP